MGSTVAQNRETIRQRGGTHDRATRGGVDKTPLQHGNNPHNLPNPDASRADFSDCKTLLTQKACQRPKSPYKSRTCGRRTWLTWEKECVTCEYYHLTNRARYEIIALLNRRTL